jgi:GTPase SAR1 family protein
MRTGLILYSILDEVRKIVFIGEGATGKTSILARYSLVSFYYSFPGTEFV